LSLMIEWGSFEVNAAIAARLGQIPLAAHAIICNSVSVWYSFPLGVANASSALVGSIL
jgi:Na+-driven multidrug efflux pump